MTEPGLDDSIFGTRGDAPRTRRERRHLSRPARQRRGRALIVLVMTAALVSCGAFLAWGSISPVLDQIPGVRGSSAEDFEGPGYGSVEVTIAPGQNGDAIGRTLQERGVVKSAGAFVQAATASPDAAAMIQPGTYTLQRGMRASDALTALTDGKHRSAGVTIAEGKWASEIYQILGKATGHQASEYEAAVASGKVKLPAEANGRIEGWLYPSTYDFDKKTPVVTQLNTMVKETEKELKKAKIPRARWNRTLTIASIIEGEAGSADRTKVARVILNRLDTTGAPVYGLLQMDSTIHYLTQKRGTITTSDKDRNSDSPYNTYKVPGLPPGPINNPGAESIEAAGDPASGDWLYFVTVNGDTGETKFATTFADHQRNVAEFQRWCNETPDSGCSNE